MAIIQRYSRNVTGRDFAVGDIHGSFTRLQQRLVEIDFDFEADRLFSVGDLVDRGPECESALEWLKAPWFHAVQGNHENIAIRYSKGNPVDRDNYISNGGAWFLELGAARQKEFARAFEELPIAIEAATADGVVGIVHADCPFPDWRQLREALETPATYGEFIDVQNYCMWSRNRITEENHDGVAGIRAVVVGHTPLPRPAILGNVYHIDTGGWIPDGSGYFTVVELQNLATCHH